MAEALFEPDDTSGVRFVPTELTGGPWDANALHGGAPAALMARAIESVVSDSPMLVSRMTVEFLRPVPMAPLSVSTSTLRPGKRVQLIGASIEAGHTEVARATALRIRERPLDIPDHPRPDVAAPVLPEAGSDLGDGINTGMGSAMEMRFSQGHFMTPGPATAWMRLRYPVVAGEEPSPLMRVMAAADFGNGLSGIVDYFSFVYINADLTVYLNRDLDGEWVCLEAVTEAGPHGVGVAESKLWDRTGPVGRSLQALLIERRPT
jgi:hypothetical protein